MATLRAILVKIGFLAVAAHCFLTLGICGFWGMIAFMPGPDAESSRSTFHAATHFPVIVPPVYAIVVTIGWMVVLNLRERNDDKPWLYLVMIVFAVGTYPVTRSAWAFF